MVLLKKETFKNKNATSLTSFRSILKIKTHLTYHFFIACKNEYYLLLPRSHLKIKYSTAGIINSTTAIAYGPGLASLRPQGLRPNGLVFMLIRSLRFALMLYAHYKWPIGSVNTGSRCYYKEVGLGCNTSN